MIIKRKFPLSVGGYEPTDHDVNSYEELTQIDWVKDLIDYVSIGDDKAKLAYSPPLDTESPSFLIIAGEYTFWVIGTIHGKPEELGLKRWNK